MTTEQQDFEFYVRNATNKISVKFAPLKSNKTLNVKLIAKHK